MCLRYTLYLSLSTLLFGIILEASLFLFFYFVLFSSNHDGPNFVTCILTTLPVSFVASLVFFFFIDGKMFQKYEQLEQDRQGQNQESQQDQMKMQFNV